MHDLWVEKKIFIVVKTYPNSSRKYQETVCTAGITEDGEWIRLYPINFRQLHSEKQYEKYTWVRTRIKPAKETLSGKRIDSFNPDMDSWTVLNSVGTELDWFERKRIIYPTVSKSLEEIEQRFYVERRSLGIFKPKKVYSLEITENKKSSKSQNDDIVQLDLFEEPPKPLENIPYEFRYRFICDDPVCKGHSIINLDWEIYEAFRKWSHKYGVNGALEKIKHKWFNVFFAHNRDTHLIVGTHNRFNTFMVIGVFWPNDSPYQLTLFD